MTYRPPPRSLPSRPARKLGEKLGEKGELLPRAPTIERDAPSVQLQLAIGREGLGFELGAPADVGCIHVTELALSFPSLRFPLDVSGGVSRFRHRRGVLERVTVEVRSPLLARWAAPKLRGIVSTETPEVWIGVHPWGATVGITEVDRADATNHPDARILAFDLVLMLKDDSVSMSVMRARGAGLAAPATALAIAAVQAVLPGIAQRTGAHFTIERTASRIARAILSEAGARTPSTESVRWTAESAIGDAWILHATRDGVTAEISVEAARANEAMAITQDADDARVSGDWTRARSLDMAALERAPRHAEVARRIAEIDSLAKGRAEAAIATLSEGERDGANDAFLRAELHLECGDENAAIAAFARAGETEIVPTLAARAFELAASRVPDPHDALVWLDRAVARAPLIARVRWGRVKRRLAAGRVADASADVEHLEAQASGARQKHSVWRRAGEEWNAAGLSSEAAGTFERALRYSPDDPTSMAGLGVALIATGRPSRGVALLVRAIELAEARGEKTEEMTLSLAQAMATLLEDKPAAIARVRSIAQSAPEAAEARGLEGRWRAELGDWGGASLAFARLRDIVGATEAHAPEDNLDVAVLLLLEGATFERERRSDLLAAQRHLGAALRVRPKNQDVLRAYREVGEQLAARPENELRQNVVEATTPSHERSLQPRALALPAPRTTAPSDVSPSNPKFSAESSSQEPGPDDEARAEELTRRLQADPTQDAVVDELATLLMRLGRSMELLALLSARIEDAPPERRRLLWPAQCAVLERLEVEATKAGNLMEASLFRDTRLSHVDE